MKTYTVFLYWAKDHHVGAYGMIAETPEEAAQKVVSDTLEFIRSYSHGSMEEGELQAIFLLDVVGGIRSVPSLQTAQALPIQINTKGLKTIYDILMTIPLRGVKEWRPN